MCFSSRRSPLRKGVSSRALKPLKKTRVGTGVELGGGTFLGAGQTVTYSAPDECKHNSIRMHKSYFKKCFKAQKKKIMSSTVYLHQTISPSFKNQSLGSKSYL